MINKKTALALGSLQSFVAIMALPAGIAMLLDPSGQGIGISLEYLESSPFSDFFIPALFLFIVNGIGQGMGAVLSFSKKTSAGSLGLILSVFLLIWIIVQVYYIGLIHFLQPLFLGLAMLEIVLAALILKDR